MPDSQLEPAARNQIENLRSFKMVGFLNKKNIPLCRGLAAAVIFFLLAAPSTSYAQGKVSAESDTLLNTAIIATVNQQYQLALTTIDQMIAANPEDALAYLFRAATLQSMMLDYEDYSLGPEMLAVLKECRKLAEAGMRKNAKDPWPQFYLGSAFGYESFYVSKQGNFLSALQLGLRSIKYFENAVRLEPQLYDAYLAIGTYKYYRSILTNKIKLPFVADEREEGITMVKLAASQGKYSRFAALNGLVWILLDAQRVEEAKAITDSVLSIYPQSRFFLWGAAECARKLGQRETALDHYNTIMATLRSENKLTSYLEAMARSKIARMAYDTGEQEQGCAEAAYLRELAISSHPRKKDLEKKIEDLWESCPAELRSSNSHGLQRSGR